jgi:hypothetical protein
LNMFVGFVILISVAQIFTTVKPITWIIGQIKPPLKDFSEVDEPLLVSVNTTPTIPTWECQIDLDCGYEEHSFICMEGDVYRKTISKLCVNHSCVINEVENLFDSCEINEICIPRAQSCLPKNITKPTPGIVPTTLAPPITLGDKCITDDDCGELQATIRCIGGGMHNASSKPICKDGHCMVEHRQLIIRSCSVDEKCVEGVGCVLDGKNTTIMDVSNHEADE